MHVGPATVGVVAIGASAGGLDPMGQFLDVMQPDTGLAFVMIQHLDPSGKSLLPDLLAKHTAMEVLELADGVSVQPNRVYVCPPGVYPSIESNQFHSLNAPGGKGVRLPIDVFLCSLAADRGKQGIGIILSGTGTDGTLGLKALKEAGGLTLVQDPKEALHDGMPRSAISIVRPDQVSGVKDMPAAVMRFVTNTYFANPAAAESAVTRPSSAHLPLATIIEVLKSSTGRDFSHYKSGTLERRIERRMALHGIESATDYLEFLRTNPSEAKALAKDFLINVTRFFRDPKAFDYLAEQVLPRLLENHPDQQSFRLWVVGCSTGEEAYSLGMVLREKLATARRQPEVQIFATDIDDDALTFARTGVYPQGIAADVSPGRLERFFSREEQHFKVVKELRDSVVFSRHDVLSDPPFSRLDLISCRNVLIYLQPQAQRQALATFSFALRDRGVLFMGSAESTGYAPHLFEPIDETLRFYRRLAHRRTQRDVNSISRYVVPVEELHPPLRLSAPGSASLADAVASTILESHGPAAVVTNQDFFPKYYQGDVGRYFAIAEGSPSQDLLSMARDGLRVKLRETIARAFRSRRRVSSHGVPLRRNGKTAQVTIQAQPLTGEHKDLMLVSFIDELPRVAEAAVGLGGTRPNRLEMARLRQELTQTHRELSRTVQELRRAKETLKTSNEEAMSLNEEFLSANEELESSKEELQSLNEELTTVNNQLRQSLEQQRRLWADLSNLMHSSAVATILLDGQLRIKLFNPRMKELFALIDADVGRPLADLLPKFADPALLKDATAAHSNGLSSEREIRAESGAWYLRSVLPCRTEAGNIEGAAITFTDVSGLKQLQLDAAVARAHAEAVIETVGEPLLVLDSRLRVCTANAAFRRIFEPVPSPIEGRSLSELGHSLFGDPRLTVLLSPKRSDKMVSTIKLETNSQSGNYRLWRVSCRRFEVPPATQPFLLLALQDITEEQRVVSRQLALIMEALPGSHLIIDAQRRIRFATEMIEPLFGYHRKELVGQLVDMLVPHDVRERHVGLHEAFFASPGNRTMGDGLNITGVAKDGQILPLDIGLGTVPTSEGILVLVSIHDLRPQKKHEDELRKAKTVADQASMAKSRFLTAAGHDLRQPLQTIRLLHGVLASRITAPDIKKIMSRLDTALADMSSLLDSLLEVSQIEHGTFKPDISDFAIAQLLESKVQAFEALAGAKGLTLRYVPSSLWVRSDWGLLKRILTNLLSNAVKYTDSGRILLGCRRHGDKLRIEVWDSGIGISEDDLVHVFDEFYRVGDTTVARGGLGLGLYIVQRFAQLLGHEVEVQSRPGKGTVFRVTVSRAEPLRAPIERSIRDSHSQPTILLVEDDVAQLDALRLLLEDKGFHVEVARDGETALAKLRQSPAIVPNLVIADFNLSRRMTGLQVIQAVRATTGARSPALIVSGAEPQALSRQLEGEDVKFLVKPVNVGDFLATVGALTGIDVTGRTPAHAVRLLPKPSIIADIGIVDDDPAVRDALAKMLQAAGYRTNSYGSAEALLADPNRLRLRCLLIDLQLRQMDGLTLQKRMRSERSDIPIIFITGSADLKLAVTAMRDGADAFLQKPVAPAELLDSIARALDAPHRVADNSGHQEAIAARIATLTKRERQVMDLMVKGELTKNIAADLRMSQRTCEHHRQSVMRKMNVKSLASLIRILLPPSA